MRRIKKYDDIDHERECLEFEVDDLLRKDGWDHTSELGCHWLWRREIEGKTVYVNKSTAVSLTTTLKSLGKWESSRRGKKP